MPFRTRYIFIASMNVAPEREALFNEVYDREHIPNISRVPGMVAAARYRTMGLTMVLSGAVRTVTLPDEPRYSAIYQVKSPEVLASQAWNDASDLGRWPGEVRPFTRDRRHVMRELVFASQEAGKEAQPARYLFSASMDVQPDKEALFNDIYDKEHIPYLLEVPGVLSAARFRTAALIRLVNGQRQTVVAEKEPRYSAMYELASPQVLTSEAWARAVDRGRWTEQVRPFTSNRRLVLRELVFSTGQKAVLQ